VKGVKDADLKTEAIKIAATFSRRVYREWRKGKRAKGYIVPIHPEMLSYIIDRVRRLGSQIVTA